MDIGEHSLISIFSSGPMDYVLMVLQLNIESPDDARIIPLPEPGLLPPKSDISMCILERKSRRIYTDESLSSEELSYMLWATQGVKKIIPAYRNTGNVTIRTVPSAGARHPFETYLAINDVTGIEQGIYRYSSLNHNLVFLFNVTEMQDYESSADVYERRWRRKNKPDRRDWWIAGAVYLLLASVAFVVL
jgi:hypothetical protein